MQVGLGHVRQLVVNEAFGDLNVAQHLDADLLVDLDDGLNPLHKCVGPILGSAVDRATSLVMADLLRDRHE